MTTIKSGIEIHQQLDTKKLFCECPSILRSDSASFEIKRKLHAVKGESGKVDLAAKHEASLDKEFIYQGYDTTCLVELDEEPPHEINKEALDIAIKIALLLNCEILPITQIMRKTVINGSNTSGFQRTLLIAKDGYIETEYGKVRISGVNLEEDSARPTGKNDNEEQDSKVYKLDRLGIPLVEIGTYPDIKTPEQAKEVALFIGDVLRSCKVKRGIGTIRQDINISIEGHPRVEIKGFQDVKMFVPTILKEIDRQKENIHNKKTISEVRNANPDGTSTFLRPMPGEARMYPETDCPLLYISREMIDKAKKELPKLRKEIAEELKATGLNDEMLKLLIKDGRLEEYKALLKVINDPNLVVKVMIMYPNEIAIKEKVENVEEILTLDSIEAILEAVFHKKITINDIKHVMTEIVKGKKVNDALSLEKIDNQEIEGEILKIVKEKPGLSIGGYMGLVMQKFKGKVTGKEATDILNKILAK